MKKNVGGYDRALRIIIGLGGLSAGYVLNLWWVALIAAIILLSGLIGWCGLYVLCGLNTAPVKKTVKKTAKKVAKKTGKTKRKK